MTHQTEARVSLRLYCDFSDCTELAERVQEDGRALCPGHRKQLQRRGRLSQIERGPVSCEDAVLEAGSAWLESEEQGEYQAARQRFLRAAKRWLSSLGWRPPVRDQHESS